MCVKKIKIWIPSTGACDIDKYLKSIIGNSVVTCDEILDMVAKSYNKPAKPTPINFNEKGNL